MTRGQKAMVGDKMIAVNGYHYIRTSTGWKLEHHVIAAKKYGREINTQTEMVVFADKDRDNLDPSNIIVKPKRNQTVGRKRARLEARIAELQAELKEVIREEAEKAREKEERAREKAS